MLYQVYAYAARHGRAQLCAPGLFQRACVLVTFRYTMRTIPYRYIHFLEFYCRAFILTERTKHSSQLFFTVVRKKKP